MYLKIKVRSESRRESIRAISTERFEVSVKEKAEANRANRRVLELIAQRLQIPFKKIRIIRGHHSPSKLVLIAE